MMKQRHFSNDMGPDMVVKELLATRPVRLSTVRKRVRFQSPGVYALYYSGKEPLYRPVSVARPLLASAPIYVGNAASLHGRLMDHIASVTAVSNLRLKDFWFRYLPMDNKILGPSAELLLIEEFNPVWNTVLTGFGNHDPGGSCRRNQSSSLWDTVHPGRQHSKFRSHRRAASDIRADVRRFLA